MNYEFSELVYMIFISVITKYTNIGFLYVFTAKRTPSMLPVHEGNRWLFCIFHFRVEHLMKWLGFENMHDHTGN